MCGGGVSFLLIAPSFPLWLIVSSVSATPLSPQVGGAAPKRECPESETPRFFHMDGGRIVITSRSLRAIGGLRPQLLYFPPSGRCFGLGGTPGPGRPASFVVPLLRGGG